MSFTLIPAMVKLYTSLGSDLPLPTKMLMKFSDTVVQYPVVAALPFVGLFLLFKNWSKIAAQPGVSEILYQASGYRKYREKIGSGDEFQMFGHAC